MMLPALAAALVLAVAPSTPTAAKASPAGIEIRFVPEAAQATLDALSGSRTDFAVIAALPGNARLIAHQKRFDPAATEEHFAHDLAELAAGRKPESDTFVLTRTKERLSDVRALLQILRERPREISDAIRTRIARYTPEGIAPEVTVFLIVGGTSDGFAEGNDFSLALDYFRDDIAGMRTLMAHELFHVVYETAKAKRSTAASSSRPGGSAAELERLLPLFEDTMNEGIASRVGDPLQVSDGKAWIEWFRGKFRRNLERLDASFTLFDTILYREDRDPAAPIDRLYQIGFTGAWDSALYFVGYEMARVIEGEDGAAGVARLVARGPIAFFDRYLEISRTKSDRVPHRFAASTEETFRRFARTSPMAAALNAPEKVP